MSLSDLLQRRSVIRQFASSTQLRPMSCTGRNKRRRSRDSRFRGQETRSKSGQPAHTTVICGVVVVRGGCADADAHVHMSNI